MFSPIIFLNCFEIPERKSLSINASIPDFGAGDGNAGGLPLPFAWSIREESPSVSFNTVHNLLRKSATRGFA